MISISTVAAGVALIAAVISVVLAVRTGCAAARTARIARRMEDRSRPEESYRGRVLAVREPDSTTDTAGVP